MVEQFVPGSALDPNEVLLFARVASLGSFSRAAEQLGLPKSTVSRRVLSLERQMGEPLLVRTTRRQRLTELGQQVLELAQELASDLDALQDLREQRQSEPSGRLRVSLPSDIANLLLTDALAAFSTLHPAVTLDLDLSPRRVDLLGEGFDLAVRMGDLPDDGLLVATRLVVFSHGLYASPDYLANHGEPQSPEDLLHHTAVRLGRSGQPWMLSDGQRSWQGQPQARVLANSPEFLVRLAGSGMGLAGVPDLIACTEVRAGRLRRVLPGWQFPQTTAWAVTPGRRLMPAKTRAFIDMLRHTLQQVEQPG
ncbi:MAG: LysR family transcriptional regulator [Burkholderiaceae bacterium]